MLPDHSSCMLLLFPLDPKDIVEQDLDQVLALLWAVICCYQLSSATSHSGEDGERSLHEWLRATLPQCDVQNLASSWNDGRNLSALVDFCQPGLIPNHASLDPENRLENVKNAMTLAERHLNIPQVMHPEDLAVDKPDKLSTMTYLSQFCCPNSVGERKLLQWVQKKLPHLNITNFTTDWVDGRALEALVASTCPYHPNTADASSTDICKGAMSAAGTLLQVRQVLLPSQFTDPALDARLRMAHVMEIHHAALPPRIVATSLPSCAGEGEAIVLDVEVSGQGRVSGSAARASGGSSAVTVGGVQGGRCQVTVAVPVRDVYTVNLTCDGAVIRGCPLVIDLDSYSVQHIETAIPRKVGDACCLTFDTSAIEGKPIQAQAAGKTSGAIGVRVDSSTAGRCLVSFIPHQPDTLTVTVSVDGKPVKESPFVLPLLHLVEPQKVVCGEVVSTGTGSPVMMAIDCSRAGRGVLTARCTGQQSGDVSVEIVTTEEVPSGVTFTPSADDLYLLSVYYEGSEVAGSPWSIDLRSLPPQADRVTVAEAPSGKLEVGRELSVVFDTSAAGSGQLTAGCRGTACGDIPVSVTAVGLSRYRVSVVPMQQDNYFLSVFWAGRLIPGAPFQVSFGVQPLDASKCRLLGLEHSATLVKVRRLLKGILGREIAFQVKSSGAGRGVLEVKVEGPAGELRLEPCCAPDDPSLWQVSYTPLQPGQHQIHLLWGGSPIPGSPLVFEAVTPLTFALNSPVKLEIEAGGKKKDVNATAVLQKGGLPEKVTASVDKSDSKSIALSLEPPSAGTYLLHVYSKYKELPNSPVLLVYGWGEEEGAAETADEEPNSSPLPAALSHPTPPPPLSTLSPDSAIDLGPSETREETNDQVREEPVGPPAESTSATHLPEPPPVLSPDSVLTAPAMQEGEGEGEGEAARGMEGEASECLMQGVDSWEALVAVQQGSRLLAIVGREIAFQVKSSGAGRGVLEVKVEGPAGESRLEPCCAPDDPSLWQVSCTPLQPGQHQIHLLWGGSPIPGSPLVFEAVTPLTFALNSPVKLEIEAGGKKKEVRAHAILREDSSQHKVKVDKADGKRISLSIQPKRSGTYLVHILVKEKELERSPLVVEYGNKPPVRVTGRGETAELSSSPPPPLPGTSEAAGRERESHEDWLLEGAAPRPPGPPSDAAPPVALTAGIPSSNSTHSLTQEESRAVELPPRSHSMVHTRPETATTSPGESAVSHTTQEEEADLSARVASLALVEELRSTQQPTELVDPSAAHLAMIEELRVHQHTMSSPVEGGGEEERGAGEQQEEAEGEVKGKKKDKKEEKAKAKKEKEKQKEKDKEKEKHKEKGKEKQKDKGKQQGKEKEEKKQKDKKKDKGKKGEKEKGKDSDKKRNKDKSEGLSLEEQDFRVGIKMKYKLHCEELGPKAPEIFCTPPEAAKVDIIKAPTFGPNTYWCEITPSNEGEMEIAIVYDDFHILGSPFAVRVGPRGLASQCHMVETSSTCQRQRDGTILFCVSVPDSAGKGKLTASVKSVATQKRVHDLLTTAVSKHHYHVEFDPSEGLEYILSVKYDERHIVGSPFTINLGDPSKCVVQGEGVRQAHVEEENVFTVSGEDAGPGDLAVAIEGEGKAVQPNIVTTGDRTYRVSYAVQQPGEYRVSVQWGGGHVPHSPFDVHCIAASQFNIVGSANQAYVGGVTRIRVATSASHIRHKKLSIFAHPQNDISKMFSGEIKEEKGVYTCSLQPAEEGLCMVHICWDGKEIRGSPYQLTVAPPPNPDDFKLQAELSAAGNIVVHVTGTKDVFASEALTAVAENFSSGEQLPAAVTQLSSEQCKVEVQPSLGGEYQFSILYAGRHISGSPFLLTQVDPTQCRVWGEGVRVSRVDSLSKFYVDHGNAGPGHLRVEIVGEGQTIEPFIASGDTQSEVSYVSNRLGEFKVHVFWGDYELRASPFTMHTIDPAKFSVRAPVPKLGSVGEPLKFVVQSSRPVKGWERLSVVAKLRHQQQVHRGTVTAKKSRKEPKFQCAVDIPETGRYAVYVQCRGIDIPGSPFLVRMMPAPQPERVRASGPGLQDGTVGVKRSFSIDVGEAGHGHIGFKVQGPSGGFTINMHHHEQLENMIVAEYIPLHPGVYTIHLTWAGHHIPGSPYKLAIQKRSEEEEEESSESDWVGGEGE